MINKIIHFVLIAPLILVSCEAIDSLRPDDKSTYVKVVSTVPILSPIIYNYGGGQFEISFLDSLSYKVGDTIRFQIELEAVKGEVQFVDLSLGSGSYYYSIYKQPVIYPKPTREERLYDFSYYEEESSSRLIDFEYYYFTENQVTINYEYPIPLDFEVNEEPLFMRLRQQ